MNMGIQISFQDANFISYAYMLRKGINKLYGWELVAHACNPSYSGGRDQENLSSKLTQANSL
jgi:hypothetical protein